MKRGWMPLSVFALLIAFAIGTVWLRLSIVRTSYSINQADQTIRALQQNKEQLQLKVTEQRSPRKLEVIAKTRFGLAQPKSDQVVYIRGKQREP